MHSREPKERTPLPRRVKGVGQCDLTHCSRCPEQTFQERQHVSGQAPPLALTPGPAVRAISNLHTSGLPSRLLCLRTFLKMWVLDSSKVKTEIKQSKLLKGKIKTLGVCGNDPGMPVTRRRRKIEKQQKPQVSLLGTPVQEPCSLQIKAKDERLGVLTSNSGHEA